MSPLMIGATVVLAASAWPFGISGPVKRARVSRQLGDTEPAGELG